MYDSRYTGLLSQLCCQNQPEDIGDLGPRRFAHCVVCMKLCAHGQLVFLGCMATFLRARPAPDTVISPIIDELLEWRVQKKVPESLKARAAQIQAQHDEDCGRKRRGLHA